MPDPITESSTQLHVVGAAIAHQGRCLIAMRGRQMSMPGKWEFPGGKVEDSEGPGEALEREIEEELGIRIQTGAYLGRGSSQSGARTIVLDVYAATWVEGTPVPVEHAKLLWAAPDELPSYDWAEADIPIVPAVQQWLMQNRQA